MSVTVVTHFLLATYKVKSTWPTWLEVRENKNKKTISLKTALFGSEVGLKGEKLIQQTCFKKYFH